ncbi:colipase [Candoia aspera]|uniref:colipase n=1 Tax=Candoia aspera TaxID=51853 RepID=UPI002FD7F8F9
MDRVWILLLLTFTLVESSINSRGLFFNLDNGELCLVSLQCKSRCCHQSSASSFPRCANKAAENQECSPLNLQSVYYKCPCEKGLICVDRTIVGSIVNSDFGICQDSSNTINGE